MKSSIDFQELNGVFPGSEFDEAEDLYLSTPLVTHQLFSMVKYEI